MQNLRFALRQMRRNFVFTVIAVSVIALGISAVTTVFSLVHAVLLKSLPYREPRGLVYLWTPNSHFAGNVPQEVAPSFPDFYDWQRLNRSFSSMTAMNERMVNLGQGSAVERIGGAFVDAGFFKTLGVRPQLGRAIEPADDQPGHGHVVVISDSLWRQRFGGRLDAIGKPLLFDREKYTIIGVAPRSFGYPLEGDIPYLSPSFGRTDLWAPLALSQTQKRDRTNFGSSDAAIARLRPEVSAKGAQTELAAIEQRLNLLYPANEYSRGWHVLVTPLVETILGPVSRMLWLLLVAVVFVLLIACANVANLLLARISNRREEIALRASLGAGRARLAKQMLTESLGLALLGGTAGILLSLAAVRVLAFLNPGNIPRFDQTAVNLPVLVMAAVATLLSGMFFGIAPALIVLRPDLNRLLRGGTNRTVTGSNRLRYVLISAEVALSFVLLTGATLLIRSYMRLEAQNPGFSRSTLTMELTLDQKYSKPEQRRAFFMKYLDALRRLPGVAAAGIVDFVPLQQEVGIGTVEIKGYGRPESLIDARVVTPGYFEALGTNLLAGRLFDDQDFANPGGAFVVNQAFVKAFLEGHSPIGRQVRIGLRRPPENWGEIVGVVANVKNMNLEEQARPEFFRIYALPYDAPDMNFAIHSKLPPESVIPAARKTLHALDPALALNDIRTMQQRIWGVNSKRRFQTVLLTSFAVLAVFLAMIGVYGVIAYSVKQRTAEIGVRMAFGASQQQVLQMVLRQGLSVVLIGLGIGILAALLLTRVLRASLYGISPDDPLTFTQMPLLILLVAGCACLLPALEASRVDPAIAIRHE